LQRACRVKIATRTSAGEGDRRRQGKTLNTEEGYIPETVPMDGWHVNVRHTEEVEEFAPYIVTPETPIRVWA